MKASTSTSHRTRCQGPSNVAAAGAGVNVNVVIHLKRQVNFCYAKNSIKSINECSSCFYCCCSSCCCCYYYFAFAFGHTNKQTQTQRQRPASQSLLQREAERARAYLAEGEEEGKRVRAGKLLLHVLGIDSGGAAAANKQLPSLTHTHTHRLTHRHMLSLAPTHSHSLATTCSSAPVTRPWTMFLLFSPRQRHDCDCDVDALPSQLWLRRCPRCCCCYFCCCRSRRFSVHINSYFWKSHTQLHSLCTLNFVCMHVFELYICTGFLLRITAPNSPPSSVHLPL